MTTYVHTVHVSRLGIENGLQKIEEVITSDNYELFVDGGCLVISWFDEDKKLQVVTYASGMWVTHNSYVE